MRKRNESAYTSRNEPRALWKALIKLTGSLIAAPRISWAFRVPGNGTPPVYNETRASKKRSGPRVLFPARIQFDHLFAGTKHQLRRRIYLFIVFIFFFFSKKARKTSHLRRIALGDTEFNRTHRCFEVAEVRDVGLSSVYTFSTSSREKNYQPFEGKIGLRFHFVLIFIDFLFSFYYLRYEFDFALQRVNQCSSLLYHVRCNFESQMNLFFFFFFKAQSWKILILSFREYFLIRNPNVFLPKSNSDYYLLILFDRSSRQAIRTSVNGWNIRTRIFDFQISITRFSNISHRSRVSMSLFSVR